MAKTPNRPTPPTPVAAAATTTVSGFAVQVLAFIPIPKDDLRKQSEIPMLILDITEGRRPLTDLIPEMRGIEFRQSYRNQRITLDEAAAWKAHGKPIEGGSSGEEPDEEETVEKTDPGDGE